MTNHGFILRLTPAGTGKLRSAGSKTLPVIRHYRSLPDKLFNNHWATTYSWAGSPTAKASGAAARVFKGILGVRGERVGAFGLRPSEVEGDGRRDPLVQGGRPRSFVPMRR
ncbi:MAG: hypothetical protein HXY20_02550 [Acidobacteria bacterium]|nr:hypothetical protein [Acidobacteriota bacterium]